VILIRRLMIYFSMSKNTKNNDYCMLILSNYVPEESVKRKG